MKTRKSLYSTKISALNSQIKTLFTSITKKHGTKEAETGIAPPTLWDLAGDKNRLQQMPPLQVATVTKILEMNEEDSTNLTKKYMVNSKGIGKYIVEKSKNLAEQPEEGMRVGLCRAKMSIKCVLPRKIDSQVSMMQIEEKPNVTFESIGGCDEQLEKIREIVEQPLRNPEKFINLGIDPPKGVLLYGPPGTGKTLLARAVANRTDAAFIRIIGSELVQRYIGEGARMVREIFKLARSKKACILFFDEVDAFGGTRFGDTSVGEVQRTMLEVLNQLDGFDARGNVKVLMATNRPDTLDPALLRPGRLDRKIEFGLPDAKGREQILKIHARKMSVDKNIRFDLIARLCQNSTGAELKSVCTEAGMYAIRERRRVANEKDFLKAVEKVIKGYAKFSSTPQYLTYN